MNLSFRPLRDELVNSPRRSRLTNFLCGFFAVALCVFVLGTAQGHAQASSSLAEVRGQVTDANGAAIPNATVTITDTARGTTRTVQTDENGEYVILGLQPTDYELRVEAAGGNFTAKTTRLTLTIGQQANIPVQLAAGGTTVQVDVVSGDEVVETERTQQSTVITPREILTLPLSRRNYLDLALLTPGVNDSDNIADVSDARVAQGRASGLSFGGNNGRGNLVTVDGGPVITTTGGVFDTVSQEAVQEFQVLRNSYSAEFGPSSGGIVNTVSKTGTNSISGSVFGLFRDDTFDAQNVFDRNPDGKSEFNRQQFGGSFGAPIVRDKTFFFTAYERFNQKQNTFVNLVNPANYTVTSSQNNLFSFLATGPNGAPFAPLATLLGGRLTTTNFPNTIRLFDDASDSFPFDANQSYFSARVDHNFNDTSSGFIRIHANDLLEENQAAGALTAVSRGRTLNQFSTGILASYTQQIGSNAVNEIKAGFVYYKSRLTPNDPFGPEINIEGFGNFGRDIFLPSLGIQRNLDLIDNFSFVRGNHTIKFGANVFAAFQTDVNETFFGGRFNFGAAIPLANVIALSGPTGPQTLAQLQTYLQTPVASGGGGRPDLLANLATPITALQSYNLGLPIVYQQGFGTDTINGANIRTGFYAQDTWKIRQNLTLNYGLRYALNREPFGLKLDKNDFQPRGGFAYDIQGDGKTVIRGGLGIFSAYVNRLVSGVIRTLGNPNFPTDNINIVLATATSGALPLDPANPAGPRSPTSFAVYQRLLAVTNNFTRPVTAADLAFFGVVPRENGTLEVRFLGDPNYKTPESYQASLAIERDLGAGFSVEASYLYNRGIYLTRNRDVNQFRASLLTRDGNLPCFNRFPGSAIPATCYNPAVGPAAPVQPPLASTDFRNPFRFQDNLYDSSANSFYHGATFTVRRRFANNFSILSHYTFSKAIDEVTDFNSDFSAQNPLDLRADRALSAFDQRHRVVLTGVYQVPGDLFDESVASRIFGGFVFSPIFTAGSGKPFNLLLGFDNNNDGRSQSDRPGQVGRNTGRGENFYAFDMRLSRRFNFDERRYLEIIAEGFNLFNRTNFQGINNIVGGLTPAERAQIIVGTPRGRRNAAPTDPLGFTSAAPARQFQFGARFGF